MVYRQMRGWERTAVGVLGCQWVTPANMDLRPHRRIFFCALGDVHDTRGHTYINKTTGKAVIYMLPFYGGEFSLDAQSATTSL